METFAFVDTNLLLHYQLFTEVDWHKQLDVPEVTIVFAPAIVSEVDDHKWSGARREKARAKSVIKKMLSVGLSSTPVRLRPGVRAMTLDEEPSDAFLAQHRLQVRSNDDRLLASFLKFRDEHPQARVLILSADGGLSTKARSRKIELVVPDDSLELPDEADDTERELEKIRRELAEARSVTPDLRLTFGEGSTHREFQVHLVHNLDEGTLKILLDAWQSRYPHAEASPQSLIGPGGRAISLSMFEGLPGYTTPAQAKEYNDHVDRVFVKYEAYLRAWPALVNERRRTLKFTPVLENLGTAPADDIDVQLWTDAPGVWLEKVESPLLPPGIPKGRSGLDSILRSPILSASYMDRMTDLGIRSIYQNEDGPNVLGEVPDQRVQYGVKRVKHHVPCELSEVYFRFASDEAIRSFAINVRLVAANIRRPKDDALHIEIRRAATSAPPPPPEPDEEQES
jgi:hypothetical protein